MPCDDALRSALDALAKRRQEIDEAINELRRERERIEDAAETLLNVLAPPAATPPDPAPVVKETPEPSNEPDSVKAAPAPQPWDQGRPKAETETLVLEALAKREPQTVRMLNDVLCQTTSVGKVVADMATGGRLFRTQQPGSKDSTFWYARSEDALAHAFKTEDRRLPKHDASAPATRLDKDGLLRSGPGAARPEKLGYNASGHAPVSGSTARELLGDHVIR